MARFSAYAFRLAIATCPTMCRRLAAMEAAYLRQGRPAIHRGGDQRKDSLHAKVRYCQACGRVFRGWTDYCYSCRRKLGIYRETRRERPR